MGELLPNTKPGEPEPLSVDGCPNGDELPKKLVVPDVPVLVSFDFSSSLSFLSSDDPPNKLLENTEGDAPAPKGDELVVVDEDELAGLLPKENELVAGALNEKADFTVADEVPFSVVDVAGLSPKENGSLFSAFGGDDSNCGLNPPPRDEDEVEVAVLRLLNPAKPLGGAGMAKPPSGLDVVGEEVVESELDGAEDPNEPNVVGATGGLGAEIVEEEEGVTEDSFLIPSSNSALAVCLKDLYFSSSSDASTKGSNSTAFVSADKKSAFRPRRAE